MKKKVVVAVIIAMLFAISAYVSAEPVQLEGAAEVADAFETETIEKVDYYNKLIEAETKKREYVIYKNQLKAQLSKIEIAYLEELETQSEEKYKIEKTKLRLGYSTEIQVEEARNNRGAVRLQIQTSKDRKRFYKDCIELNGGEYEAADFTEQTEELKEDYISDFKENSVQMMYYKLQLQEYNETLRRGGYGIELEELEKQIELCEMQEKQYEIDLELYVRDLLLRYDSLKRQVEEKDNQIAIAEKKIENAVLLQEEGKISAMRLNEMEIELQGLQYEKAVLICDMKLIYYILENALENQEV